ncbi:MAG TPA: aldo/keto reductase [Terriglobia bacterium]|nr:aldo/keto reductase [Terriglobia bacterium]
MLIPGFATPEGTRRFKERFAARLPGHYREARELWTASIGLGTYLGDPTPEVDERYRDAAIRAAGMGTNVFDTAANYRHMRSERAIGKGLAALISSGSARRDEVIVTSKGGFLAFDGELTQNPSDYFREKLIEPGIVRPEEVVAGCHVMSPRYLAHQIDVSRANLGVGTIDIYYLHNPETQLKEVSHEEFQRRLKAAIAALEQAVAGGKIRMYGAATWTGFRTPADSEEALALESMLEAAVEVGGKDHHFCAVQLPFNIAMPEALTANTQPMGGKQVPFLHLARERGLMVFSSASLLQGQLSRGLPDEIRQKLPGLQTDAQRAIQFVRSTPGITCALAGMSRREHLEEDLSTASVAPLTLGEYRKLFQ